MNKRTPEEAFKRLMEIKDQCPELVFDNDGYEYLKPEVKERHKEQIAEITAILKEQFSHLVRFDNFKPRKDGSYSIRCQTKWDASFTGVEYFLEEHFKTESPTSSDSDGTEL